MNTKKLPDSSGCSGVLLAINTKLRGGEGKKGAAAATAAATVREKQTERQRNENKRVYKIKKTK